jgi:AcrR family transcriptional regulator
VDRRQDRGQATREQLVTEATRLFADRGFDATSVEAVLDAAGVSRGSLYHHFKSKDALFEAVLDAAEVRIGEATLLAAAGAGDDPAAILRAGALEWIRLAGDPVVQRIVLIDAPAVLGWERWREIEEQNALGNLRIAMQAVADDGRIDAALVDPFAHMLLAAVNELALMVARADDTETAQRQAEVAVDELLTRLLAKPGAGGS